MIKFKAICYNGVEADVDQVDSVTCLAKLGEPRPEFHNRLDVKAIWHTCAEAGVDYVEKVNHLEDPRIKFQLAWRSLP